MKKYILLFFIPIYLNAISQEEKSYVFNTFRSTQLINSQTTEMVKMKGWDFSIKHRFGVIGMDSSIYQQFLGLDLPANIRFGFAFPITERLYVGCGRTKNGKTVDVEAKYLLLRQTEENKIPISLAIYFNTAIMTDKFPRVPSNAYFSDSTTAFSYKFNHRLSYNTQIIIARKITEKISFQISPVFIYRNLVPVGEDNYSMVVPLGGSIKTGLNSSVVFEYAYRFNNHPLKDDYPLSLAWESGTVGHTFQIVISSSNELIEQDLYTKTSFNYLLGNFALGFNLRRTFWYKKKKTNP